MQLERWIVNSHINLVVIHKLWKERAWVQDGGIAAHFTVLLLGAKGLTRIFLKVMGHAQLA